MTNAALFSFDSIEKISISYRKYKILSYYSDIDGLFAFLAFAHFEFYVLTFFQTAEPFFVDTCVVNENVAPRFGRDKAVTFG